MISILIPIYNCDVTKLAKTLNEQCKAININYEIVCFDDFSKKKYKDLNRALDHEFGISYLELSENHGRSKIRNKLAKNARYEKLILLDCDSEISNENFLQNYIDAYELEGVVYGGRNYKTYPPKTINKYLHWKYGRNRESQPYEKRTKSPYLNFQSNNFMIDREIMLAHPFEETISGYGYEDLVFANQLKTASINIIHIDNPLFHKGIEYNEDFLAKSKVAAENLAILYHQGKLSDTRMLKFHAKLKKVGFNSLLHKIIQRNTARLLKNLKSKKPNLLFFDLYRFGIFQSKLIEIEASSS